MDYEKPRYKYNGENYALIFNENFFDNTTLSMNTDEIYIYGIELYEKFNGNLVIPEEINSKPVTKLLSNHPMVQLIDMANKLKSIDMPSVKVIGASAFMNCSNLEKVNIPNVETIYDVAFKNCNRLKNIAMPNIEKISWGAFENCSSLTNINMANVKKIEMFAFSNCSNLTNISIPSNACIQKNSFHNCSKLNIEKTQEPPTQAQKTSLKYKIDNVKQKLEDTKSQPTEKQVKNSVNML